MREASYFHTAICFVRSVRVCVFILEGNERANETMSDTNQNSMAKYTAVEAAKTIQLKTPPKWEYPFSKLAFPVVQSNFFLIFKTDRFRH